MSIYGEDAKTVYEGKRRYADRKMAENALNPNLTSEQHDVLSWVCRIRHEIHCDPKALFFDEATNHKRFWDAISEDGKVEGNIKLKVASVGLPPIDLDISYEQYITDSTYELDDLTYEEALDSIYDTAETVNTIIEEYLMEIDEKYGTNYAPTGMSRM